MPKVLVLYYSKTGNTEKMAKAVMEGVNTVQGVEVELNYYVPLETLGDFDAIIVGVPTYHHDLPIGVKKLFEEAAVKNVILKGKKGAVFGSYGWSGEAPHLILEIMENKFGMQVLKPLLLIKYAPDEKGLEECRKLGRNVAKQIQR